MEKEGGGGAVLNGAHSEVDLGGGDDGGTIYGAARTMGGGGYVQLMHANDDDASPTAGSGHNAGGGETFTPLDVRMELSLDDSDGGGGGGGNSLLARLRRRCCACRGGGCCCGGDPLLVATLVGVCVGIGAGALLRVVGAQADTLELVGFPGELMLRLLKLLVLPLIAGSMVGGVCSLRGSTAGVAALARYALSYYLGTTLIAVVLGIALVSVVQPGAGEPLAHASAGCGDSGEQLAALSPMPAAGAGDGDGDGDGEGEGVAATGGMGMLSALLGVVRTMVPDNIVAAAVDLNILGVIVFSVLFGAALSSLGPSADAFIGGVAVFNDAVGVMVGWALWTSPAGVASLLAASIAGACDLRRTLASLGLWVLTVLLGLGVMAAVVLPAILWTATRRNPLRVLRGFGPALTLAAGTSSSSAALPVTMECARALGAADGVVRFFLPLGVTVNMNGTALYEATTVLFIAQAHGVQLSLAQLAMVTCTATLAAMGAAAIPSAGLVTMIMVLQAVGLAQYAGDLAVILTLDWLLDRCRTVVNTLSDGFGTLVVDALVAPRGAGGAGARYSQLEPT